MYPNSFFLEPGPGWSNLIEIIICPDSFFLALFLRAGKPAPGGRSCPKTNPKIPKETYKSSKANPIRYAKGRPGTSKTLHFPCKSQGFRVCRPCAHPIRQTLNPSFSLQKPRVGHVRGMLERPITCSNMQNLCSASRFLREELPGIDNLSHPIEVFLLEEVCELRLYSACKSS